MLIPHVQRKPRRAAMRGLGVVEMLVGLALGLFVIVGALMMFSNFTNDSRLLVRDTRLQQDLRATADLITRDLRRAGYWAGATTGVYVTGMTGAPPQNAYALMSDSACAAATLNLKSTAAASSSICYAVAQDANNSVDSADRFGFELDGGVVYAVLGGATRQALSDPKSINMTDMVITPSSQVLSAAAFCSKTCTVNCPEVVVRQYEVLLKGHPPSDSSASRFLRSNLRVRNDYLGGVCPA